MFGPPMFLPFPQSDLVGAKRLTPLATPGLTSTHFYTNVSLATGPLLAEMRATCLLIDPRQNREKRSRFYPYNSHIFCLDNLSPKNSEIPLLRPKNDTSASSNVYGSSSMLNLDI